MKKIVTTLLLIATLFCIIACKNTAPTSGIVTVVIRGETDAVYNVDLAEVQVTDGVLSILQYLKDEKGIALEYEDSGYGAFLTKCGSLKQDLSKNEYLYLYTSVQSDFDVSGYATTQDFNGKTLTSAGVGLTQMQICDGAIILIATMKF